MRGRYEMWRRALCMEDAPYMTTNRPTEYISSDAEEIALALEAQLDAALADTFPASDPVAITVSAPRIAGDRR